MFHCIMTVIVSVGNYRYKLETSGSQKLKLEQPL